MSKVLVTTALGNVGREVARACVARGLTIRVSHREEAPLKAAYPGLETARVDFLDSSSWPAALAGIDQVFLVRPPPIGKMETTLNPFIDAAYAAGVKHLLFLSVAGADRMKWVPHRKVELHLEKSGTAWTVLRPGFFAQNLEEAYRADILEDSRLYVPAAEGRVAFLDVRDVGDLAALLFEKPEPQAGQALTLTGPEALTFSEVAHLLTHAMGRSVVYQPASVAGYLWHLSVRRKLPLIQVAVQTVLHLGLRRGDAEEVDPTLERLLGRRPHSIADYLARTASHWKNPPATDV